MTWWTGSNGAFETIGDIRYYEVYQHVDRAGPVPGGSLEDGPRDAAWAQTHRNDVLQGALLRHCHTALVRSVRELLAKSYG